MRFLRFLLLVLVLNAWVEEPVFAAEPADIPNVTFSGLATQGGLIVGETDPRAVVTVDGRRVRVSPGGLFLLGFGREATGRAVVEATFPDGRQRRKEVVVGDRDFPVQRIDGLPPAKVTPSPEALARIRADTAAIGRVRAVDRSISGFSRGFDWPVKGRISGVFGSQRILNGQPRSPHSGVDIAAPAGTPVGACADGVVVLVHPDMYFTGQTMMIDHGHGLLSVYAHLSAITVAEGQVVERGQEIGRVGASGRATGAHLHWGLSLFDVRLDPALVVPPMTAPKAAESGG